MSGHKNGWVEVIVGSMFSGKTEELIRRLNRATFAKQKIQVFKPMIDDRYHATDVTSHNRSSIRAMPVKDITQILEHLSSDTQIVGIDEGQFFSDEIVKLVQVLANRGIRVIVAGLDTDWKAQPFGPMPQLMAIAELVTKQHAVCVVCGGPACRTQRTSGGDEQVQIGATDSYEARCRHHFRPEKLPSQMVSQKQIEI